VVTAKSKKGHRGPPGPPGPQGAQGLQGPAGLLGGSAGGDLTGNYPAPQIAPEAVGPGETAPVPAAKAVRFSDISIPSGTQTPIPFDHTLFDYSNMHSDVTNNERLTAPINGLYLIEATLSWDASDGGGVRAISVAGAFGGGDVRPQAASTGSTINNASAIVELFQGDEVHVDATQTSGSALNVVTATFSMVWLGPIAPA
jgi:hypothetical protein